MIVLQLCTDVVECEVFDALKQIEGTEGLDKVTFCSGPERFLLDPFFVGPGEAIKVDTRSGEYMTRA